MAGMHFSTLLRTLAPSLAFVALGCQEIAGPDASFPVVPRPDDVELTEAQRLTYEEDAVRLALRHGAATDAQGMDRVEPPATLVESLFNALTAVHGTSHPARDTVIDVFGIRAFPNPAVFEVMVRVDPAVSWTQSWSAEQALTGNAAVDDLVTRYGISVRQYYRWSIGDVALLRTSRPLNMAALAARFATMPGVIWAEPNGYGGDGNDIRARPENGGWRLEYSVGFGDCPAGCIGRHVWTFAVDSTGAVRYLGGSGDPLPSWPPR
jgi:hypothetical protein